MEFVRRFPKASCYNNIIIIITIYKKGAIKGRAPSRWRLSREKRAEQRKIKKKLGHTCAWVALAMEGGGQGNESEGKVFGVSRTGQMT